METDNREEYEIEEQVAYPGAVATPQQGENVEVAEDEDDDADLFGIPRKGPIELKAHDHGVNTISLDSSGAHLVSGGDDYNVRLDVGVKL